MKYRVLLGVTFGILCNFSNVTVPPVSAQVAFIKPTCSSEVGIQPTQECVNGMLGEGRALVSRGDFAGALTLYQKAAQVGTSNARVFSAIGFLQVRQNDFSGAVVAYQKAIALDPSNSRFHYALGFSLAHLGDNEGAAKAYRRVIELAPSNVEAYLSLGIVLSRQGDYRRALFAYATALALQPKNPQIYQAIGATYHDLGKYQEANAFFERAGQLSYSSNPPLNGAESGLIGYRK